MKALLFTFLIIPLLNSKSLAQILTKEDFKKVISENKCTISLFTNKNFKIKYSGPRKEGGILTHLQNQKANELLFLYDDDNRNFQSLIYYLPNKNECSNLYLELKRININASKRGRVYEKGRIYYQIAIRK